MRVILILITSYSLAMPMKVDDRIIKDNERYHAVVNFLSVGFVLDGLCSLSYNTLFGRLAALTNLAASTMFIYSEFILWQLYDVTYDEADMVTLVKELNNSSRELEIYNKFQNILTPYLERRRVFLIITSSLFALSSTLWLFHLQKAKVREKIDPLSCLKIKYSFFNLFPSAYAESIVAKTTPDYSWNYAGIGFISYFTKTILGMTIRHQFKKEKALKRINKANVSSQEKIKAINKIESKKVSLSKRPKIITLAKSRTYVRRSVEGIIKQFGSFYNFIASVTAATMTAKLSLNLDKIIKVQENQKFLFNDIVKKFKNIQ